MALTQTHFRFRTDANAVDATPTWGAAEDASPSPATTPFRLRLGLNGTSAASGEFEIYAKKNAGSYAAVTTSATGGVQSYDASSDADDTIIRIPRLTLTSAWWLAGAALDLDFTGNRIYPSGTFADYLSCSRASIGYAKNANGTLTQFSTDTLRMTDLGLLVEDARTNNLSDSQVFTGWSGASQFTITNSFSAPDGTNTASKLIPTTGNGEKQILQLAITTITGALCISVYSKQDSGDYNLGLNLSDGVSNCTARFDSSTGNLQSSLIGGSWSSVSFGSELLANNWRRYFMIATTSNNFANAGCAVLDTSFTLQYSGDGTSGIYLWGVQLESGSFTSSYIPTTTTSAARAADVITNIGTLQSNIAAATGSIVVNISGQSADFAANVVDSNGTNLLGFDATNHALASITAALATTNTANRTSPDKLGIAWNASGRSLVLNGGTVATDASAQTPSSTQHLGSSGSGNSIFAYIRRLTFWTSKLADATLQGFTLP